MDFTNQIFSDEIANHIDQVNNHSSGTSVSSQEDKQITDTKKDQQDKLIRCVMRNQVPTSETDLAEFAHKVRFIVEKKFVNLMRSCHLYLCYIHLLTYNYS